MKILTKIFLILLLLNLAGCKWFSSAATPWISFSRIKVPPGTPAFQKGFKAGCSTVLYARGNVWYKTWHKHQYDPKLIDNAEYRGGYSSGYSWCFQISVGSQGIPFSPDKYLSPYGNNSVVDWNNPGVDEAWGGMFGGGSGVWGNATNSSGFSGIFEVLQGDGGVLGAKPLWY